MKQGGIALSAIGYIQVHVYTGNAKIPLQGAAVTITDPAGSAIAMRLTNRSGKLDQPVEVDVPDISAGQQPNTGIIPFTSVNLIAHLEDYEQIRIERLQVFPNTETTQNLEMIPLSELPEKWNQEELLGKLHEYHMDICDVLGIEPLPVIFEDDLALYYERIRKKKKS